MSGLFAKPILFQDRWAWLPSALLLDLSLPWGSVLAEVAKSSFLSIVCRLSRACTMFRPSSELGLFGRLKMLRTTAHNTTNRQTRLSQTIRTHKLLAQLCCGLLLPYDPKYFIWIYLSTACLLIKHFLSSYVTPLIFPGQILFPSSTFSVSPAYKARDDSYPQPAMRPR